MKIKSTIVILLGVLGASQAFAEYKVKSVTLGNKFYSLKTWSWPRKLSIHIQDTNTNVVDYCVAELSQDDSVNDETSCHLKKLDKTVKAVITTSQAKCPSANYSYVIEFEIDEEKVMNSGMTLGCVSYKEPKQWLDGVETVLWTYPEQKRYNYGQSPNSTGQKEVTGSKWKAPVYNMTATEAAKYLKKDNN